MRSYEMIDSDRKLRKRVFDETTFCATKICRRWASTRNVRKVSENFCFVTRDKKCHFRGSEKKRIIQKKKWRINQVCTYEYVVLVFILQSEPRFFRWVNARFTKLLCFSCFQDKYEYTAFSVNGKVWALFARRFIFNEVEVNYRQTWYGNKYLIPPSLIF